MFLKELLSKYTFKWVYFLVNFEDEDLQRY